MADLPTRLVIAYALIGLILAAGITMFFWMSRNTQRHRDARARARLEKRRRLRDRARAKEHTRIDR